MALNVHVSIKPRERPPSAQGRDQLQKTAHRALRGAVIIVLAAVLALGKIALDTSHNTNHLIHQQHASHVAQLRGCHRLNVERARNNRNWSSSYQADKAILHYDLTFRTLIIAGLKHQTSQVKRTPEQERATQLFVAKLGKEINGVRHNMATLEWVPLTDCYAATDHPTVYTPPEPVLLSKQGPPESALIVGPGE